MKPECELDSAAGQRVSPGSASSAAWSSKLKSDHCKRLAIVHVRQSTTHRVRHHRESAARQ